MGRRPFVSEVHCYRRINVNSNCMDTWPDMTMGARLILICDVWHLSDAWWIKLVALYRTFGKHPGARQPGRAAEWGFKAFLELPICPFGFSFCFLLDIPPGVRQVDEWLKWMMNPPKGIFFSWALTFLRYYYQNFIKRAWSCKLLCLMSHKSRS